MFRVDESLLNSSNSFNIQVSELVWGRKRETEIWWTHHDLSITKWLMYYLVQLNVSKLGGSVCINNRFIGSQNMLRTPMGRIRMVIQVLIVKIICAKYTSGFNMSTDTFMVFPLLCASIMNVYFNIKRTDWSYVMWSPSKPLVPDSPTGCGTLDDKHVLCTEAFTVTLQVTYWI